MATFATKVRQLQRFFTIFATTRQSKSKFSSSCGRISSLLSGHVLRGGRPFLMISLPMVPTVHAFWGSKKEEPVDEKAKLESILRDLDEMYAANKIGDLYLALLKHKELENDEIYWRLARAACDLGKLEGEPKRRERMYEAYAHIEQAMQINKNNFAVQKWYAILLDYVGEYEGTKQRIANAYKVKEHLLKAIELNPKDATSIYSLGFWCFLFADMPWYQRKIAAVIFATPPSSTYDEALQHFQQAENVDPNFYSMNLVMLGKTYSRLGNKKMAILYLTKARGYPIITPDDKQAHKEAVELLNGLGVKTEK